MKVAYISGPYRSDSLEGVIGNIARARAVALKYWKLGYAVICPHLNTALFDGACPDSVWLEGDIEILKRCDVIVMMVGYEKSKGAKAELAAAKAVGLEVIFEAYGTPI